MDPAETNPDVRKIGQRKAKTHKGRRHLDKYKPKLREGDRQCIIIKGNKTSDSVTKTMQYFVLSSDSSMMSDVTTTSNFSAETRSSLSRMHRTSSFWLSRT